MRSLNGVKYNKYNRQKATQIFLKLHRMDILSLLFPVSPSAALEEMQKNARPQLA
jgi:hypothetical protein